MVGKPNTLEDYWRHGFSGDDEIHTPQWQNFLVFILKQWLNIPPKRAKSQILFMQTFRLLDLARFGTIFCYCF
jgi:hypothetical protein